MFVINNARYKCTEIVPKQNKMGETITLQPVNKDMKVFAQMVSVKNEFLKLGFTNRNSVIVILKYSFPEIYKKYSEKDIELFWVFRLKNERLNNDLERVLEALKSE